MGHATIPAHLLALLSAPQTGTGYATDALEEWILHRRGKGDTLFDVSVGLAELEDRTPPHLGYAFDRARYVTNVPQPSDLTPPMGPFPLARSAAPPTILHHLLSHPPPSIAHSREIILEYVLARELRLKEKKSGRAGKGTLGRDGFEDIGKKMGEIEDGLRGGGAGEYGGGDSPGAPMTPSREAAYPSPKSPLGLGPTAVNELNENQQIGLALVLSLRMSLSYFSLHELAEQLMLLALADAERTLVQHIRRRVPGEGRWGVGKELEYVESMTLTRRPALRPAFRSSKARTLLPPKPLYPIQLPAPSKSQCTKLIHALAREVEAGGPPAGAAFLQTHAPSGAAASPAGAGAGPAPAERERGFLGGKVRSAPSPTASAFLHRAERDGSPQAQPSQPLPPFLQTPPRAGPGTPGTPGTPGNPGNPGTPTSAFGAGSPAGPAPAPAHSYPGSGAGGPPPPDPQILANYTMELISEYLTREKREHMLKSKWAKTGRAQLSKDLGEIEASLCLAPKSTTVASALAPVLLPTFLLLRRTFALPPSPLPHPITEPYADILPAPPDPDDVPFREPTVGTTTAALYVNPRLDAARAHEVLEELVEFEREKVEAAGGGRPEVVKWVGEVIESVQKRFPDGSYEQVFARIRENLQTPIPSPSPAGAPSQSHPSHKPSSIHRRAKSNAFPPPSSHQAGAASPASLAVPSPLGAKHPYNGAGRGGGGAGGGAGGAGDGAGGGVGGGYGGHARSVSMPSQGSTVYDGETDSSSDSDEAAGGGAGSLANPTPAAANRTGKQDLPHRLPPLTADLPDLRASLLPLQTQSPLEIDDTDWRSSAASGLSALSGAPSSASAVSGLSGLSGIGAGNSTGAGRSGISARSESGGGWWDVVSAISPSGPAPWDDSDSLAQRSSRAISELGAGGAGGGQDEDGGPGAAAAAAGNASPRESSRKTSMSLSGSGSGLDISLAASGPASGVGLQLPPGAEAAKVSSSPGQGHVVDFTRPMMDLDLGGRSGDAGGGGRALEGLEGMNTNTGSPPVTANPGPLQNQNQTRTTPSTMHAPPPRPARSSARLSISPPRPNRTPLASSNDTATVTPGARGAGVSRSPVQHSKTLDPMPTTPKGYDGYYIPEDRALPPRRERPAPLGSHTGNGSSGAGGAGGASGTGSYGSSGSEQATPTQFGVSTLSSGPPPPSPAPLQTYPGKLFPSPTATGPAPAGLGRSHPAPPPIPSTTLPPAPPPASQTKSKLTSFGRNMSLAGRHHKKDKDKDAKEGKEGKKEGGKVQNDPGRWNRDMVASIMGPSAAERR